MKTCAFLVFINTLQFIFAAKVVRYIKYDLRVVDCYQSVFNVYTRSHLMCSKMCSSIDECKRYMYCDLSGGRQCFLYKSNQHCYVPSTYFLSKCTCHIKKSVQIDDGVCTCTANGFYGDLCENIIRDCLHGSTIPEMNDGEMLFVQPPLATRPFEVACKLSTNILTLVSMRGDSYCKNKFDKTWELYKLGFGDVGYGYWLGLEHLHQLLSVPGTVNAIEFMITLPSGLCGEVYQNSSLGDATTNYTLYLGTRKLVHTPPICSGDIASGPLAVQGRPFVTIDHTSDTNDCPAKMKSGWWFADDPECTSSNVNGPFGQMTWELDTANQSIQRIEIRLRSTT